MMRSFLIAIFVVGTALAAEPQPETCIADGTCAPPEDDSLDTQSLLQTGASQAVGEDVCPSDAALEAKMFWKDFFKHVCKVDDDDVPKDVKDDIAGSTHTDRPEQSDGAASNGCRIVTSLSGVGGRIEFDAKPPPADGSTGEGWSGDSSTAVRQMNVGGQVNEKHGASVCEIFGDGIPRIVDIPAEKVSEVFDQVQEDFARVCPNSQLALATDTSMDTVVGRRSMVDSAGNSMYTFSLSVSVPDKDPVNIQVTAEEDPFADTDSTVSASTKAFETQVKRKAEGEDNQADVAKGGAGLISYGDFAEEDIGYADNLNYEGADVASYIQSKMRVNQIERPDASGSGDSSDESGAAGSDDARQDHDAPATNLGPLRVLEDQFAPLLCCLCGSCVNSAACSEGADGNTPATSFIEDDAEEKMREQDRLYPEYATNNLLEVGTATAGSKEEQLPPPIPGDVVRPSDFRVRAEPEYGDNFHSLILPRRTPEDHQQVWATSRSLIETAKAEGLAVPAAYHYYDHDDTARCFQKAYNQGKCGSCWAFASLGALEKQICLRAQGDVRASLSREMLVRCSEQNNGCQGGNADKAYEDLMEIGGVFSTDCLPYQGKGSKHCPVFAYSWFGQGSAGKTGKFARIDQEIQKSCGDHTRYSNRPPQGREWDMPFRMMYEARFGQLPDLNDARLVRFRRNFAKTRSRDRVPSWWLYGQEAMKTAITKYGSVYASFKVRDDFKKRACPDGCWPPGTAYGEEAQFKAATCGCGKGHAVHIIGFGEDIQETGTKVPYWLIENSWGDTIHGDVFGEDSAGVKGFGTDPFTEDHPMGIEDKCLLAGWAYSSLPKSGGCGGNANINLRDDVKMKGGPPDGYHLSVRVDGVGKGNWSIEKDSVKKFQLELDLTPGPHQIMFQVYAKNHPKLQSFDVETYGVSATSLRCRGKGYRYSFTQNDTKASLSWGRMTREELKAEADKLVPTRTDEKYLYGDCPKLCRTGRYSWVKPCLGLLAEWGSCYTDSWAMRSDYMLKNKKAMCTSCAAMDVKLKQQAYAVKSLDNATFLKWYSLVSQSWDAPDTPGWMRMNNKNCKIVGGGFVSNALLSATYNISMPSNTFCDERHSAPYAKGKFVHAPGKMEAGAKVEQRCPPPMVGKVNLECRNGALYALSNTCTLRPGTPDAMKSARGYYKTVRGVNYHGIESGAAFGIAEMNRFADRCPTLSWTRWTECNASVPCTKGVQHRSRSPISLSKDDPKCVGMMFEDERTCVGPGFCPQVLTRFVASGSTDIAGFLGAYKRQSTTMDARSYATAGAAMMSTSSPTCNDAKYWCKVTTGKESCDMYMEGHFQVKKDAEYYLHYETVGGGGTLEFNTLGEGSETKPQFQVRGGSTSSMWEWQDLGFHHRRRRSESKPWQRISTMKLSRGTYYARMTRAGWSCPSYQLKLEQLSSVYRSPLLLGAKQNKTAASMTRGSNGGSKQKTTTWWNNWGAIPSWTKSSRERNYGGSYAKKTDTGSMNELLLRDMNGGKVIKRSPITKFNYTADELYALVGVDKFNLPSTFTRWGQYELVIRNTVILPEAGEYVFKFQMDTSFNAKNQAWQAESRRRQTKFEIRAGNNPKTGTGASLATFSAWQGSGTKSVSFKANEAGTVPFEASICTTYNAPGDKMLLPNSVLMEVKRKDILHGDSLDIGTQTKYMSDLMAIRGDTQVRIDWPERDDPLSSELKSQTFDTLPPQALLIGNENLLGFQALAEAKIDAGACTSLEAWANDMDKSSTDTSIFWGVGLNLCDVDGNNQYLELVTYHPPSTAHKTNGANNTKVRVGWVHVGFTQPTHMRIIRDPLNLGNFDFGYKPDNRASYATPFSTLQSGYTGKMEVGVSMNSAEAYRYAEFYNISIEECPIDCNDAAGKQLFCGDIVTPCGNRLNCSKSCSAGGVCRDEQCMDCPKLTLNSDQQAWECGKVGQQCANTKGQKIQVTRDVGTKSQPTMLHFCNNEHNWHCVGQSKWVFLAEGKECGTVKDNCNADVALFPCPMTNDVCESHKCKCTPATFPQDYNCGSEADGCGMSVHFGSNQGSCPGSTDRCMQHKCCTPKTRADFDAGWQCGRVSDGCGGYVELNQAAATPFFKSKQTDTTSNSYTGQRGIEIQAANDFTVASLARGLMTGGTKLSQTARVSIWDVATKAELGHVDVGSASAVKNGYAWEALASPVKLVKGKKYRIVQKVVRNMKDKYTTKYLYGSNLANSFHNKFASFKGLVATSSTTGYPEDTYINRGQGMGIVSFDVLENDGCGAGLWTCHTNHTCTKKELKGFLVESGPCETSGNCVTSKSYGSGNYGNGEKCTIKSPSAGVMKVTDYKIESWYDYLNIDGKDYRSSNSPPPAKTLTAPITLKWSSDGSVTNKGFKVCVESSLLQNEAQEEEEQEEDASLIELSQSELAELSEDERQHALAKYQQYRDEEAAEVKTAAAVEKEEAEMEAKLEEEEEAEGSFLDEDELALPDLTQDA